MSNGNLHVEEPAEFPQTAEEYVVELVRYLPGSVRLTYRVHDSVNEHNAYTKRVSMQVTRTACDGTIVGYDPTGRVKMPGGECPSCGALLCQQHIERIACVQCHETLCVVCARPGKDGTMCGYCFESANQQLGLFTPKPS